MVWAITNHITATSMEEAIEAARKIGYPVLIRAAYALGGLGSGFADNEVHTLPVVLPASASTRSRWLTIHFRA